MLTGYCSMRLKIYLLFLIEQKDFYFSLDSCGLHLLIIIIIIIILSPYAVYDGPNGSTYDDS